MDVPHKKSQPVVVPVFKNIPFDLITFDHYGCDVIEHQPQNVCWRQGGLLNKQPGGRSRLGGKVVVEPYIDMITALLHKPSSFRLMYLFQSPPRDDLTTSLSGILYLLLLSSTQRDVDESVVDHSCGARGAGPIAVAEPTKKKKMHNGTFTLYKSIRTNAPVLLCCTPNPETDNGWMILSGQTEI
jgi:hypothetical protein